MIKQEPHDRSVLFKTDFNVSRKRSSSLFDGDVKERHTGDSILS